MAHGLPTRVPPGSQVALGAFAKLTAKDRIGLIALLGAEGPPYTTPRAFIGRLAEQFPAMDEDLIARFCSAIFSMSGLAASHGWPMDAIAASAAEAQDLDLTTAQRTNLHSVLEAALSSRSLVGLAKAVDVGAEHERLFHLSRIMTDLRPVFRDADEDPLGLVMTHKLRIDFFGNGDMTSIEVALTEEDLTSLAETIERARRKAASLKAALSKADLTLFDLSEG